MFVLIVCTVCNHLVGDRMHTVVSTIREDQHKTVMYEAAMLLKEGLNVNARRKDQHAYRINRFLYGLRETDLFDQPEHIMARHPRRKSGVNLESFGDMNASHFVIKD